MALPLRCKAQHLSYTEGRFLTSTGLGLTSAGPALSFTPLFLSAETHIWCTLMSKITVTPEAQKYLFSIIEKQKMPGLAIRLTVNNPCTPAVESGILYCPKEYINLDDLHFKMEGFEIVIAQDVATFLDETEIDLGKDDHGDDLLTMHCPNLKKNPVGDDAPLKEQVAYFVEHFLSKDLAGHGGAIRLINFTDDGVAEVEFSGGCQGCSQASYTLHNGLEQKLFNAFPGKVTAVKDVTNHASGENPYA